VRSAVAPVIDHLKVTDGNSIGINFIDTVYALASNVDVRNLKDSMADQYYGYGIHSQASIGTTVVGLHADKVWHATDNNTVAVSANHSSVSRYGADIGMNVQDSVAYGTTSGAWSWHSEANHSLFENVYAFDAFQFGVMRGMHNTMRDSVGINLSKGLQVQQWSDSDAYNLTFENVILREVDNLALFSSRSPSDITITDSTFEAYGKTGSLSSSYGIVTDTTLKVVSSNADTMNGTSGRDMLFGGAGADTIIGNGGNDLIWGGAGVDRLTGGAGSDRFFYNNTVEFGDVITDFAVGANGDVLDLGVLLTRVGYDGSNPIGDGYVRLLQARTDTLVQFDANGGGNSYATVATLTNVNASTVTANNLDLTGVSPGQQLIGGSGSDRLVGGKYDDYFKGGGGADKFVFGGSTIGEDIIMDFKPGVDRLEIARNIGGNGIDTVSEVLATARPDVVGNVTLNLGNGNEITLLGVTPGELTAQSITMI
jgi:Ca2+-binding RTX toxin-like protein